MAAPEFRVVVGEILRTFVMNEAKIEIRSTVVYHDKLGRHWPAQTVVIPAGTNPGKVLDLMGCKPAQPSGIIMPDNSFAIGMSDAVDGGVWFKLVFDVEPEDRHLFRDGAQS